jgi:hypothetical protein
MVARARTRSIRCARQGDDCGRRGAGGVLASALVIRLQPGLFPFAMPPERKPKTEQWHGGMVRLPTLAKPGIYQITLLMMPDR